MALAQLIYTSKRTPELTIDTLRAIADAAAERNRSRGITGVLINCGEHIMQVLEGEVVDIVELYERIRDDGRHEAVRCLLCKNVDRRLFPEWGMTLYEPRPGHALSAQRMADLIAGVRNHVNTAAHPVEARILLDDFRRQVGVAA